MTTTTAIGAAILTAVFELWLDAEPDAELEGNKAEPEPCDIDENVEERVGAVVLSVRVSSDLVSDVRDETEGRFVVFVVLEVTSSSTVASGYGSRAVVKFVEQQSTAPGPPRPCPAAPAQHQLLAFASHRLTSV